MLDVLLRGVCLVVVVNSENSKMKKITLVLLLFSITYVSFAQITNANDDSFPTNFDSLKFEKIKKFNGEIIAFDGVILDIKNSRNNTPFYKLDLGANKILWTALMFKNDENKVNDKVRVVGYLKGTEDKRPDETYLNSHDYMVIAFGLVDFESTNFLFLNGANIQKQQWIDGKIPTQ